MYVELCEEDKTEQGDEHWCGKLIQSMCRTREAAHDWQAEVTRTMKDLEFKQGKALHMCSGNGKETSRHSCKAELEWLIKGLKNKFETKVINVGEDDDMAKIVRWHPRNGITFEA